MQATVTSRAKARGEQVRDRRSERAGPILARYLRV